MEKKMKNNLIIMNKEARKVRFPYKGKNLKGEKETKWLEILPGNNHGIDSDLWAKIKEAHAEDFENYWDAYLKEIKMKGENKKVDYSIFDLGQLKEYVGNVVDLEELEEIKKFEKKNKSRSTIINAIEKQT